MITSRVQIEDGQVEDFYKKWGFIYLTSSRIFAAPEKERKTVSYAEEAGEHVDPRTVEDAYDYEAEFLIETPNENLNNANTKILAWNNAIREATEDGDIKRCKTITFYDDRKRRKIVGIPEVISSVDKKDFYRDNYTDCVVVKLKIRVTNPKLCELDTPGSETSW